jgi:hypothetical protein
MYEILEKLPVTTLIFQFQADYPLNLEEIPGDRWRGLFGMGLHDLACVTRETDCTRCMLYRSCVYSYFMHTPPPQGTRIMTRYNTVPHPYMVLPPQTSPQGDDSGDQPSRHFEIPMRLLGKAPNQLPYLIQGWSKAVGKGIGQARIPARLLRVEQLTEADGGRDKIWENEQQITKPAPNFLRIPQPPQADQLAIELLSPLRMKRDGGMVRPGDFTAGSFLRTLLRRCSLLSYFHGGGELELDYPRLVRQADTLATHQPQLQWKEQRRYSGRQRRSHPLDGLIGQFSLDAQAAAPFWPLLWIGQWTGLGKATSMGLGRYRMTFQTFAEHRNPGAPGRLGNQ